MAENNEFQPKGLKHGGRVLAAAKKYHIAKENWVDLSTGLNPNGWPVPKVPTEVWQALPEDDDGLQTAACQYYGCDACLPVAGSQVAIQILPTLRSRSKVGVISPTYAEHEYNWKQSGHDVTQVNINDVDQYINELDVLVVINPNNPTGDLIKSKQLLSWYQYLSTRGGWLIIDEAFMDVTPEHSLVSSANKPGLIILRSMGKFFGIAGIRCGFVIADNEILQRLAKKIGPWSLTGPTRFVAKQALLDKTWQVTIIKKINESSIRLRDLLSQSGLPPKGGTALFQWLEHAYAEELYEACAEKGVLIRLYKTNEATSSLRFGLPASEKQWQQLNNVLNSLFNLIRATGKNKEYV